MVKFKLSLISAESVLPDRPFDNFRTSNLSINVFILLEKVDKTDFETQKGLLGENRFFLQLRLSDQYVLPDQTKGKVAYPTYYFVQVFAN